VDIVLANLPYIPTGEIDALEPEVSRWEPRLALDGGEDGFALIRRLIADCDQRLHPRLLALEVGFGQAPHVASELAARGRDVEIVRDLAGIERVVCARWQ
jgi:release factor glutamine methyltransferase